MPWTSTGQKIEKLVRFLEKDRFNLFTLFVYLLLLAVVRDVFEMVLFEPIELKAIGSSAVLYGLAHHVAFYFAIFLGILLAVCVFSSVPLRKAANFVSVLYVLILIPPLIDRLAGFSDFYQYLPMDQVVNVISHLGTNYRLGQVIEIGIILFSVVGYAFIRRKERFLQGIDEFLQESVRLGLMVAVLFLSMAIAASPSYFLPITEYEFPSVFRTGPYQWNFFLTAFYIIASLGLFLGLVVYENKVLVQRFLTQDLRPFHALYLSSLILAGATFARPDMLQLVKSPYWIDLPFVIVAVVCGVFLWQAAGLLNDLHDSSIDALSNKKRTLPSNLISRRTAIGYVCLAATVSLVLSLLLSIYHFFLAAFVLALSYAYSVPPFRLRRHLASPLIVGIGAAMAFLFGYLTPQSESQKIGPNTVEILGTSFIPSLSQNALWILLMVFAGITVGAIITSAKDRFSDKENGISTLFSTLKEKDAFTIASLLVFAVALTPLSIVHSSAVDFIVFLFLGVASSSGFYLKRDSQAVFLAATVGLIYAALRTLGLPAI